MTQAVFWKALSGRCICPLGEGDQWQGRVGGPGGEWAQPVDVGGDGGTPGSVRSEADWADDGLDVADAGTGAAGFLMRPGCVLGGVG